MDNYAMWQAREREEERRLSMLPVCAFCGHPIQDETLFDINGELYHENCAIEEFRKWTEDCTE